MMSIYIFLCRALLHMETRSVCKTDVTPAKHSAVSNTFIFFTVLAINLQIIYIFLHLCKEGLLKALEQGAIIIHKVMSYNMCCHFSKIIINIPVFVITKTPCRLHPADE